MAGNFAHVEHDNAAKRRHCLKFFQMSFHVLAEICNEWGFSIEELQCPSRTHLAHFEDNRSIQIQYACQVWQMFGSKLNAASASASAFASDAAGGEKGNDTSGDKPLHDEPLHDDMEGMDVVDATTRSEDGGEGKNIDGDQANSVVTAAATAAASASASDVVFEDSLMKSAKLLSTSMVTTDSKKMIFPACVVTLYLHGIFSPVLSFKSKEKKVTRN